MNAIIFFLSVIIIVLTFYKVCKQNIVPVPEYGEEEYHNWSRDRMIERANERNGLIQSILRSKPWVLLGVFSLILVITIFNSVFFTTEQQTGYVAVLGKPQLIQGSGLHFRLPYLSQLQIDDSTIQGMPIGYVMDTNESIEDESLMISSDFNLVQIDFYLEYFISDPIEYHYGSDDPEGILYNIAQGAIRNSVGQVDIDSILTTGKAMIEEMVYASIVDSLNRHHTGITLVNAIIQDAEVPTAEVDAAFKDVENARQEADKLTNEATKYKNTQIPAAEAQAWEISQAAIATRTERENQAKEEVATFNALFAEYVQSPSTVKQRLYLEALEEVLPNLEIIVGEDSRIFYVKDGGQ